ncbi:MAG TPA: hypothetical protein VFS21_27575 [Roseiflexaceae bacterium]|nr:hypothetical protein [Roseiflexaceae bacterium]
MSEYITSLQQLPPPGVLLVLLVLFTLLLLPTSGQRTRRNGKVYRHIGSQLWWYRRTPRGTRWAIPGLQRLQGAVLTLVVGVWALGRGQLAQGCWAALRRWLGL